MCHVVAADLRDDARLAELFEQAAGTGLVKKTGSDRLRFFSAAEHAIAVGTLNICGLFATVVRRGLWGYINQAEEDVAIRRLKRWDAKTSLRMVSLTEEFWRTGDGPTGDDDDASQLTKPDAAPPDVATADRAEIRELIRESLESVVDETSHIAGQGICEPAIT